MPSLDFQEHTKKELARLARDQSIPGWHAMRKDQLIRALADRELKSAPKRSAPGKISAPVMPEKAEKDHQNFHFSDQATAQRLAIRPWHGQIQHQSRDRMIAVARDPY
ncbi:MAG: hypothetical protein ACKO85_08820, partial [Isosphaeraceae bacterium]